MFKKVVNIRHKFIGKKVVNSSDPVGPSKHTVRRNPCMSQPVLGLDIVDDPIPPSLDSSRTNSTENYSSALQSSPTSTWNPGAVGLGPLQIHKSTSLPVKARPSIDSIPTGGDQVRERLRTHKEVPDSKGTLMEVNRACDISQQATPRATLIRIPETPPPPPQNAPIPAIYPNQNLNQQLASGGSVSSRRTSVPRIANMPPSAFRINDDGTARLSPSIITRPSPRPILNLPTLPPTSTTISSPSTEQNTDSNSDDCPRTPHARARLSSIPALSQDGMNRECDHDNAGTDTEEEDMDMDMEDEPSPSPRSQRGQQGGSDDEDGDDLAPSGPSRDSWGPLSKTPTLRLVGSPTSAVASTASNGLVDYFSARPHPSLDPSPSRSAPMPATPVGSGSALLRPPLYQHASKSMVNILSPKAEVPPDPSTSNTKKGKMPAHTQAGGGGTDIPGVTPPYTPPGSSSGLRRRSMPIFQNTSDPPPYPSFALPSRPTTSGPRDDEGRETLPCYSNSIHLVAIMPRKMEFTAPGIQAKDRKWRRALCELEGTVFRVYKCPPGLVGGGVIGEWWEKKVGVGDAASGGAPGAGPSVKLDQRSRGGGDGERPNKLTEDVSESSGSEPRTQERFLTPPPHQNESTTTAYLSKPKWIASNLLHPITRGGSSPAALRAHSRSRSDGNPLASMENEPALRSSLNISRNWTHSSSHLNSSLVSSSTGPTNFPLPSTSPPASASRSTFALPLIHLHSSRSSTRPEVPLVPDRADLIKAYTLQHAESGLGNDYLKRKNVIRVRMEGEQFLLQAQDVMDVVDWIEVSCRSFLRATVLSV